MKQYTGVFIADPTKSLVNTAVTGTKTLKKGTGADFNITGYSCLRVNPTALSSYYFNSDTTKTHPLPAGVDTDTPISSKVTQVVLVLSTATASVQGM